MKKILFIIAMLGAIAACEKTGAAPSAPQAMLGGVAPLFTLPSQDGSDVSLKDYQGKWVVLYFYPKDFSGGCTIEAHNFQEDTSQYNSHKAVIIGVSGDDVKSHKGFCAKQGISFKLLSDTSHKVSESYGAVMENGGDTLSARTTFLIDPTGVIRREYRIVDPAKHSKEILKDLERLQAQK